MEFQKYSVKEKKKGKKEEKKSQKLFLKKYIGIKLITNTKKQTLMYRTVLWTLWERERVG